MLADAFFDTSVLIYAIEENDSRAAVVEGLLSSGGYLSVQVLNEFVNVARRKLGMDWDAIEKAIQELRILCAPAVAITSETHEAAIEIAKRYKFHICDSQIVASALETGSSILYSEDLQHGQKIESLIVRNPFL